MRQARFRDVQGRVQLLARDPLRRRRLATVALLLAAALGPARTVARRRRRRARGAAPPRTSSRSRRSSSTSSRRPTPRARRRRGARRRWSSSSRSTRAGAVDQARVVAVGRAAFDAAAAAAARQFVFEPAEIDGKPAPIRILYRYEFVLRAEAPTTADLAGQVRDARTKKPLAAVRVTLDGGAPVTTDAEGHFHVDALPPGQRTITLSGAHLTEIQTTESLEAGRKTSVTYDVEPQDPNAAADDKDDLEIVVAPPAIAKQVVSTEVTAEEARKVPGTQGDVLKVVENLPGVARPAIGSAQLVVWGSSPQDTRVFMDGVPLPSLYHQGGFRSVVHSDMVQSVELVPGGWGAEYGRGLGGLVDVHLKPLDASGVHGSAAADILDASADVRAKVSERLSVEVAGRESYLDRLLPAFTSRNIGEYVPIPRYYDGQARAVLHASPAEMLELGGLISGDSVDDNVPSDDPTNVQLQTHRTSFQRAWLRWKKQTTDGAEILVVSSFGFDSDSLVDQFGAVPTALRVDSTVGSLRASWRKKMASWVTLAVGIDGQLTSSHFSRTGSNTSPPRPGDPYVFGQAPTDQIAHDDGTTVSASAAPYATADFSLDDGKIHLVPGVRIEPYLQTASRTAPPVGSTPPVGLFEESTVVEPRLSARWSPVRLLTWKVGWGIYDQPPAPADLSSVFGNPTLGIESAQHLLWGVEIGRPDVLSFEATAFETTSKNLAVRSPLAVAARRAVARRHWDRANARRAGAGAQAAREALLRLGDLHALAKRTRERARAALLPLRLRSNARPLRRRVVRARRGVRRRDALPLHDGVPADAGDRGVVRRADRHLPALLRRAQLDANSRFRPARRAAVEDASRSAAAPSLEAYLDVQNVTDRSNPEEIVYSLDYTQRRYITGLPILPVAGARLAW